MSPCRIFKNRGAAATLLELSEQGAIARKARRLYAKGGTEAPTRADRGNARTQRHPAVALPGNTHGPFTARTWVLSQLGQSLTLLPDDRANGGMPDQQGEASDDKNSVVQRSGWAADRIIVRACRGRTRPRRHARHRRFLLRSRTRNQNRRSRVCRRTRSIGLRAGTTVHRQWAHYYRR
jgi:hypothetical protein